MFYKISSVLLLISTTVLAAFYMERVSQYKVIQENRAPLKSPIHTDKSEKITTKRFLEKDVVTPFVKENKTIVKVVKSHPNYTKEELDEIIYFKNLLYHPLKNLRSNPNYTILIDMLEGLNDSDKQTFQALLADKLMLDFIIGSSNSKRDMELIMEYKERTYSELEEKIYNLLGPEAYVYDHFKSREVEYYYMLDFNKDMEQNGEFTVEDKMALADLLYESKTYISRSRVEDVHNLKDPDKGRSLIREKRELLVNEAKFLNEFQRNIFKDYLLKENLTPYYDSILKELKK